MENRRAILWSLVAAIIAGMAFYLYVERAVDNRIGDLEDTSIVLQAIQEIPPDTRIDSSMFIEAEFPTVHLPPRVATDPREVEGQVAVSPIMDGEPILTTKLVPPDETSLDRRIPEGYRAVTVGIRDDQEVVGVGGMLRPGHFIDILLTLFVSTKEIEDAGQGQQTPVFSLSQDAESLKAETRTIFQNVKILAVGRDTRVPTADVRRNGPRASEEITNMNVTVALPPEDVQKLVLAQQVGRIMLSLRRFNDTQIAELDYLDPFRAFGIELPVVSGPPPAYREIRGGDVVRQPF